MLDHLVVAARTVEEGARFIEERLGVPTVAGGKHPLMGTHRPRAARIAFEHAGASLSAAFSTPLGLRRIS